MPPHCGEAYVITSIFADRGLYGLRERALIGAAVFLQEFLLCCFDQLGVVHGTDSRERHDLRGLDHALDTDIRA